MKVLIDTSVWSEFLRRKVDHSGEIRDEVRNLIDTHRVVLIGPVRQELLSGIKKPEQLRDLRAKLRAFHDQPIGTEDFETAAEFYNKCRSNGVQGSMTDFLICAVAVNHGVSIFTTDRDFDQYRRTLPISLHSPAR